MDIEIIWKRICNHEGEIFRQIKGKEFTYSVNGNYLRLSTTNYNVSKKTFEKAIEFLPLQNTVPIQNLQAPSYLYAILMDSRITNNNFK